MANEVPLDDETARRVARLAKPGESAAEVVARAVRALTEQPSILPPEEYDGED